MGIVNITPAGEKVTCRSGSKTTFQFNVSNASGRPLRVGIDVRADGDAGSWLSVEGPAERDLSEGVDTTISVELQPPKNLLEATPEDQTFTFRLRVYDTQQTENSEDSATVSAIIQPAKKQEKKCLWCWLAPVIAVLVIAIGITTWFFVKPNNMPDYTGKIYAEIETKLSQKYELTITEEISDLEPGTIISQVPAAGDALSEPTTEGENSPLSLIISAVSVIVPNVIGETVASAQASIENLGLVLGKIEESSDASRGVESALVTGQEPRGDTPVLPGTVVDLLIPTQKISVPSVKGLRVGEARAALEKLGLRVSMETRSTGQTQQGLIFNQVPLEGTIVQLGETIKVIVEKTSVRVPNLIGQHPKVARRRLESLGFVVKSKLKGRVLNTREVKVVSQTPKNTSVDIGSEITISYPYSGLLKKMYINPIKTLKYPIVKGK